MTSDARIESQLAELQDFEQVVQDIHDICVDLSVLVDGQKESVTGVSKRAQAMDGNMESAKKDMQQAAELKQSGRQCLIIAVVVVVLVVAVTATVLGTVVF